MKLGFETEAREFDEYCGVDVDLCPPTKHANRKAHGCVGITSHPGSVDIRHDNNPVPSLGGGALAVARNDASTCICEWTIPEQKARDLFEYRYRTLHTLHRDLAPYSKMSYFIPNSHRPPECTQK
jgi:hypothetical protein